LVALQTVRELRGAQMVCAATEPVRRTSPGDLLAHAEAGQDAVAVEASFTAVPGTPPAGTHELLVALA
jgi:hypothetical protein